MDPDAVRVCPYCHSDDLSAAGKGRGAIDVYECGHCGYTGRQFLEMNEDVVPETPKAVEDLPQRKQNRVGVGPGQTDANRRDRVAVAALLLGIAGFMLYLVVTVLEQHVI